ncbi:MAG: lysylphosphatidylglycerol synthase transmembrane domain-containing protein [Armatimonadota bacterium]
MPTEEQGQLTADQVTTDAVVGPERPSPRKWAKYILASAVTVAIFVVLLRKIDARGVVEAVRGAQTAPLVGAAVLSIIIKVFVGADKWRRILAALSCRVPLGEALFIRTANAPLRVTPGKLGTLLAAVYLWRHRGLAFAKGVSSLMLERLQNLTVLLAFIVLGPMFFQVAAPAQLNHLFSGRALLVSAACVVILGTLYAFRHPLYDLAARRSAKLANVIRDLASCFHEIRAGRQAGLLLYAAVAQAGEITMGYLIFRALGVSVPFGTVLVGLALIVVVSNIPITLLGFGTRELTVLYLFSGYAAQPELLAVGMLISAIGYILPLAVGLPFLAPFLRTLAEPEPAAQANGTP